MVIAHCEYVSNMCYERMLIVAIINVIERSDIQVTELNPFFEYAAIPRTIDEQGLFIA